jgi:type II secretory pathway pseudopilin PulG
MRQRSTNQSRHHQRRAFTMIEMLTILVIIGALASVIVPVFQDSTIDAKDATLMYNLKHIRLQIERFRAEHRGQPPGFNGWHPFLHLLFYTRANGGISLTKNANYPYGPYLTVQNLANPFNQGIAFEPSMDPASESPDDEMLVGGAVVGWFYDADTGRIAPNTEGKTSNGTPRVQF